MRRTFLVFIILLFIAITCYLGQKKQPNIILITFDALRADHLGCYGYSKDTSPFIDSIAKESLVFKNCIANSGSTVPSISSIFTSRFPFTDAAVSLSGPYEMLTNKYLTLSEFLRSKGYTTIGIIGHKYVSRKFGFSRGFDYYNDDFGSCCRYANEFLSLIKKISDGIFNKKFFLWMHIREPHTPYRPPTEYVTKFLEPFTGEQEYKLYEYAGKNRVLSNWQINKMVARYDGNIRYADDNLKEIFEYFGKKGLLKNSIIIITSDHGESLGEHLIFDHNYLNYGTLRVPLIIRAAGLKKQIINYPVSSVDIFPTILDFLGYKSYIHKLNLRGKSLLPVRVQNDIQFSEYPNNYSLIKNGWRLHLDHNNKIVRLFNIDIDPYEKENLIDTHKEIYEDLLLSLNNIIKSKKDLQAKTIDKNVLNLDKADIEHLKALGYLN